MNIEQMTQKTREALQAAQRIAVEYSNNAVEQEHLLAALAQQQDGLIPQMLQTLGVDANAFAQTALQKVEALTICCPPPVSLSFTNDFSCNFTICFQFPY